MRFPLVSIAALCLSTSPAFSARIKDLASLRGARNNQLLGYGIVMGLAGTGDRSSELTDRSLTLALKGMGIDLKQKVESKNTAAVVVSAVLPPFAKNGQQLDVIVSSVGSASSLDGGVLVATALRGPDGNVYALAQGKIVTTKRGDSNKLSGQTLVTATVPSGALLEREIPLDFASQRELRYQLNHADFTTAARMSRRINEELGGKFATAVDAGTVEVILPYGYDGTAVDLVAKLESIDVEADRRAKVVVNQRSGTVVFGEHAQIAPIALAHNNLKIEIKAPAKQGAEGSDEATVKPQNVMLVKAPNIADLAAILNETGASADDLVALIHAIKASGALMAEVEVQ